MKVEYKGKVLENYVTVDAPWALDVSFEKPIWLR